MTDLLTLPVKDWKTISMELLLGIPLGILASLAAWWVLFHGMKPTLDFSNEISCTPDPQNQTGYKYRIKVCNSGSRDILDVSIAARVSIKGIRKNLPDNTSNFDIKLGSAGMPFIESNRNKIIRVFPEKLKFADEFGLPHPRKLETILETGEDASLTIYVFGNDGFTGTRHLFKSPAYSLEEIVSGFFFLGNSLTVDRDNLDKPRHKPES